MEEEEEGNVVDEGEKEARVVMFYGEVAESIERQAAFLGVSPDEYIEMAATMMSSVLEPMVLVEQRITKGYEELLACVSRLTELSDRLTQELEE